MSETSFTYRNKLLQVKYFRSENKVPANVIDANVEGDWLLYAYIVQLDEETFTEMPVGLGDLGEAYWTDDNWSELMPKIADESRKHGWCVVQFYDSEPRWRVFTVATFSDWIRETIENKEDDTTYIKRKGAKFVWTDDLTNGGTEDCIWNSETIAEEDVKESDNVVKLEDCFLVKFREGDGQLIFAYSDIPDALLDVVFNTRQIKGQMDFIGAKPGYRRYVYGPSATTEKINELDAELKDVDTSAGIGASEDVLKDIVSITDEHVKVVLPIFEKEIEVFAGIVRLPVSYLLGQRTGGGLGMEAEKTDLLKIDRKKNALFKRYEPTIKRIFFEHYGITIDNLELPQDETIESVLQEGSNEDNDTSDVIPPSESKDNPLPHKKKRKLFKRKEKK